MDRKKNLETCLVIATGLVIIFLLKGGVPLLITAIIIGFIGVFLNKPASWITWLWYKIADVLGAIVSKIMLSIVYFVFLFPIALLYRISGNDRLGVKARKKNTLWIDRGDHTYSRDDLMKPW